MPYIFLTNKLHLKMYPEMIFWGQYLTYYPTIEQYNSIITINPLTWQCLKLPVGPLKHAEQFLQFIDSAGYILATTAARWTLFVFSFIDQHRSVAHWLHLAVFYWTMPGSVWPLRFSTDKRLSEVRSRPVCGWGECETADNIFFVCVSLRLNRSKWGSRFCLDKLKYPTMDSGVLFTLIPKKTLQTKMCF